MNNPSPAIRRLGLAFVCACSVAAGAVWTTDGTDSLLARLDDIELEGVSLRHDGTITLAPELTERAAPAEDAVWQLARDRAGNVWFGTGSLGRLHRVGRPAPVFESGAGDVMAVAADGPTVWFATTPEGKVYRLTGDRPEEWFETFEKYIFALLPAPDGAVYCATGERGKLYRITGKGKGVEVFAAPQSHIVSLAWLVPGRELLAGTSPDGLVYRLILDRPGERARATVLYDTPLNEVRSIVAARGLVYAAANPAPDDGPSTESASVFCTDSAGLLRWRWSASDSAIFALAPSDSGVYVATGSRGLLYELDTLGRPSVVARVESPNLSCLLAVPDGLWLGTGSPARVHRLGRGYAGSGSIQSPPFDCQNPARITRLDARVDIPGGAGFALEVRTGNSAKPDSTWSGWFGSYGGPLNSPPGRFIQWRANFLENFPGRTPALERVDIWYDVANRPPAIRRLALAPLPADEARNGAARPVRAVTWDASDPDGDSLSFELWFRRRGEAGWQRVGRDITDSRLELDTRTLPDGWYELKLVASDRPENGAAHARQAELVTRPFPVDNTPPLITDLRLVRGPARDGRPTVTATFTATDALSPLAACRIAANSGDWQPVRPADGVFDSPLERFSAPVEVEQGNATIAVWVTDTNGNIGTARAEVR